MMNLHLRHGNWFWMAHILNKQWVRQTRHSLFLGVVGSCWFISSYPHYELLITSYYLYYFGCFSMFFCTYHDWFPHPNPRPEFFGAPGSCCREGPAMMATNLSVVGSGPTRKPGQSAWLQRIQPLVVVIYCQIYCHILSYIVIYCQKMSYRWPICRS